MVFADINAYRSRNTEYTIEKFVNEQNMTLHDKFILTKCRWGLVRAIPGLNA